MSSGGSDTEAAPAASSADGGAIVTDTRLACLYWSSVSALTNDEYASGLPEAEYLQRCSLVQKLEFFMFTLDSPEHLADFPNLVELAIHLEKVPRIVGLHSSTQLQRLCMTECGLKRMSGIEACTQLAHLDLSHNKLAEMEPDVLSHLGRLKTL